MSVEKTKLNLQTWQAIKTLNPFEEFLFLETHKCWEVSVKEGGIPSCFPVPAQLRENCTPWLLKFLGCHLWGC